MSHKFASNAVDSARRNGQFNDLNGELSQKKVASYHEDVKKLCQEELESIEKNQSENHFSGQAKDVLHYEIQSHEAESCQDHDNGIKK